MTHRAVFLLPSFAGGGAERVTLNLLRHLDRARFDSHLVVIDGQGPLKAYLPGDVPLSDLRHSRLSAALPALISALRRLKPAVVFSTLVHVNLALLALRPVLPRGVKIVVREANLPSRSLSGAFRLKLMRAGCRWLYPKADAVLCNSRKMADEIEGAFAVTPDRVHLLPNPVDREQMRHKAGAPLRETGEGARFVAAGRLTRQKGFDRLLDMFAGLTGDARLTIFGEGPDARALEALGVRLGVSDRVRFAGFEPAPWAAYAGADAFLLPSRWEGMPNVALEALALGTPVIATPEAGGIGELAERCDRSAVILAEAGPAFVRAMASVSPDAPLSLRPSLLPSGFEPEAVALRLGDILADGI